MARGDTTPSNDARRTRLSGWKEIAVHCDKGVRTVQRWERELALPVHRMRTARAETVFAWSDELDAWLQEFEANGGSRRRTPAHEDQAPPPAHQAEPADAAPSSGEAEQAGRLHAFRWLIPVASLAASIIIVAAGAMAIPGLRKPRNEPASLAVDVDRVRALDAQGKELWYYSVGHALRGDRYVPPYTDGVAPYLIDDIDKDGHREVLFLDIGAKGREQPLYCLNSDGSFRFSWSYRSTVRFGSQDFPPPFKVLTMLPGTRAGRPVVWASASHFLYFPTVLAALDVQTGQPLVEHWNPGYLTVLAPGRYMDREVLFAGGVDNSRQEALLLVIDPEGQSSSTPVEKGGYRCPACPAAAPLAAFLFPTPDLTILAGNGGLSNVAGITPSPTNVGVNTRYPTIPYPGEKVAWSSGYYTLDTELRPVHVELHADYEKRHRFAERAGLIPHAYSRDEESQTLPLRVSLQGGAWQPRSLHVEKPHTVSRK